MDSIQNTPESRQLKIKSKAKIFKAFKKKSHKMAFLMLEIREQASFLQKNTLPLSLHPPIIKGVGEGVHWVSIINSSFFRIHDF